MTLQEEKNLRIESAELGVTLALRRLGLVKDEISEREAYRIYGQSNVRSWVNRGLTSRVKVGAGNAKATYSRIELDTIKSLEDRRKL